MTPRVCSSSWPGAVRSHQAANSMSHTASLPQQQLRIKHRKWNKVGGTAKPRQVWPHVGSWFPNHGAPWGSVVLLSPPKGTSVNGKTPAWGQATPDSPCTGNHHRITGFRTVHISSRGWIGGFSLVPPPQCCHCLGLTHPQLQRARTVLLPMGQAKAFWELWSSPHS